MPNKTLPEMNYRLMMELKREKLMPEKKILQLFFLKDQGNEIHPRTSKHAQPAISIHHPCSERQQCYSDFGILNFLNEVSARISQAI